MKADSQQPLGIRRAVGTVLRARPGLGLGAFTGAIMHAAGHAVLAGAAGMLARSLASGGGSSTGSAYGSPYAQPAVVLALAGVFAALVKLVGSALGSWSEARIASSVGATVRLAVLDRVLALDVGARTPGHSDPGCASDRADRLTALTSHVHDIERGVAHGVVAEVRAAIALAPLGGLLVVLAPRLAGSAVLALAAFAVLAFGLRRAFKRAHARAAASAGVLVEAADEAVRHAELWATYGAARRIRAHVERIGAAIARESAAVRVRAALTSSTSEVLGALALALVLLLAHRGYLGVDNGTVVPFAIVFFMAYKPLRDLVEARLERAKGQAALDAALRGGTGGPSQPVAERHAWTPAALVLDGVVTEFGSHAPVSVAVPAGAIVAVVGPTGSGKTSLLRALLGLAPLRAGCIHWGEQRIDGHGVGPAERPFAWVPQDAPIVGDTLAVNIGLGRADDAGLDVAAILARLGASSLAGLGDEMLGLRRPLSGGERQWIAVARALASGQPALLLDEPTSALDPASEEKLLAALAKLRGSLTIVIVTHRPAPIAIADLVLRLDAQDVDDRSSGERNRVAS